MTDVKPDLMPCLHENVDHGRCQNCRIEVIVMPYDADTRTTAERQQALDNVELSHDGQLTDATKKLRHASLREFQLKLSLTTLRLGQEVERNKLLKAAAKKLREHASEAKRLIGLVEETDITNTMHLLQAVKVLQEAIAAFDEVMG